MDIHIMESIVPTVRPAEGDGLPAAGKIVKAGEPATTLQSVHLLYLDGLRGLAAFYIFIFHIFAITKNTEGDHFPSWFYNLGAIKYGYLAVDIFIVLSGFCLMLPISKGGFQAFPKGISNFLLRRARRILPPYYAALALSIASVFTFPSIRYLMPKGFEAYNLYDPTTFAAAIISHLLLVHNLFSGLIFRLNGPLWSVATEWQIYFVFAFVLLPLRNKCGPIAPILLGFIVGALTIKLGLNTAHFWYIGSFAMGMAAADIAFLPNLEEWRKRVRLGLLTSTIIVFSFVLFLAFHHLPGDMKTVAQDFVVAMGSAAFMGYAAIQCQNAGSKATFATMAVQILSHPLLVGLGRFSYSLYLIHFTLLCVLLSEFASLRIKFHQDLVLLVFFAVPVVLVFSYLFYIIFERPFLSSPRAIAKEA